MNYNNKFTFSSGSQLLQSMKKRWWIISVCALCALAYWGYIKFLYAQLTEARYVRYNNREAIRLFEKIKAFQQPTIEVQQSMASVYCDLAQEYRDSLSSTSGDRANNKNLVLEYYRQAEELHPLDEEILSAYAGFCRFAGERNQAIKLYKQLMHLATIERNSLERYSIDLLDCYMENNDLDKAEELAQKTIHNARLESDFSQTSNKEQSSQVNMRSIMLLRLARIARKRSWVSQAMEYYIQTLKSEYRWAEYHNHYYSDNSIVVDTREEIGILYNDQGDFPTAIKFLENSVGIYNGKYKIFSLGTLGEHVARRNWILGNIYLKVGRKQDAIRVFREAARDTWTDEPERKWARAYLSDHDPNYYNNLSSKKPKDLFTP